MWGHRSNITYRVVFNEKQWLHHIYPVYVTPTKPLVHLAAVEQLLFIGHLLECNPDRFGSNHLFYALLYLQYNIVHPKSFTFKTQIHISKSSSNGCCWFLRSCWQQIKSNWCKRNLLMEQQLFSDTVNKATSSWIAAVGELNPLTLSYGKIPPSRCIFPQNILVWLMWVHRTKKGKDGRVINNQPVRSPWFWNWRFSDS